MSEVTNGSSNSDDREPTKEELEAEFDPNDKDLTSAVSKIQACFRGNMSRKIVPKPKAPAPEPEPEIDEITKKAEELGLDMADPELHKAATKIQASFRGHKVRKDADDADDAAGN